MGIFDTVGQGKELLKMRSQALAMQKKLKQISHTEEDGDNSAKVTGDQKMEFMKVDGEPRPDLVKLINKALDQVQKDSAKQMMEEGGLSSLLKGF